MAMDTSKMSSYGHVRFVDIPEAFTTGDDIECSYIISTEFDASSRDWIGLYKVGWRSSSDYVCYVWSSLPSDYECGVEIVGHVTFTGFYQISILSFYRYTTRDGAAV